MLLCKLSLFHANLWSLTLLQGLWIILSRWASFDTNTICIAASSVHRKSAAAYSKRRHLFWDPYKTRIHNVSTMYNFSMLNMVVCTATARFYYINILILGKIYRYIPFYQLKEDRVWLGTELSVYNNTLWATYTVIVIMTNKKEKCIWLK